jgi:hypothetical protein
MPAVAIGRSCSVANGYRGALTGVPLVLSRPNTALITGIAPANNARC